MVDYIKLDEDEKKSSPKKRSSIFSFKSLLLTVIIVFLISSIISGAIFSITPKIAVVPIDGPILTQEATTLYGSAISSRQIANTLRTIEEDDSVKAVILDINSPGGSPVASEEISRAIESLKKEKNVYALVSDVGASGAFWIAVSANETYASSMSTLGSIGVTSAGLGFEEFIKKYNISYRRQTAGEHKDLGSPYRAATAEEEAIIQGILDEIHDNFINHVAKSRGLEPEFVREYATGEIFLGSKALELGFIDHIGYYDDLVNKIENETGGDLIIVDYGPEPTFTEAIGLNSIFNFNTQGSQILLQ